MGAAVWFPWLLALLFAGIAVSLWLRIRGGIAPLGEDEPGELGTGESSGDPSLSAPSPLGRLRGLLAPVPRGGAPPEDVLEEATSEVLQGLFRYLDTAVLLPLMQAVDQSDESDAESDPVHDAVHALEDLGFYSRVAAESEEPRTERVVTLIRAVTQEFERDVGVWVRFHSPPEALTVRVTPEGFKDALYLLLVNAGHFGGGGPVEVSAEEAGDRVRVTVRDRGPGFSEEALKRAFRPFWTSEEDALGLGLTHARRTLRAQDGQLSIRNREGGGAEVEILVPRGR